MKPIFIAAALVAAGASQAAAQTVQPISPTQLKKVIAAQKGRAVVVNVWATWCLPCVTEMPALAKLQKNYAKRGLSLILVSADAPSTLNSTVKPFLRKNKIARSYAINDSLGRWADAFDPSASGAFLLPRTYVYNRVGKRVATLSTDKTYAQWEAVVKPLLK